MNRFLLHRGSITALVFAVGACSANKNPNPVDEDSGTPTDGIVSDTAGHDGTTIDTGHPDTDAGDAPGTSDSTASDGAGDVADSAIDTAPPPCTKVTDCAAPANCCDTSTGLCGTSSPFGGACIPLSTDGGTSDGALDGAGAGPCTVDSDCHDPANCCTATKACGIKTPFGCSKI